MELQWELLTIVMEHMIRAILSMAIGSSFDSTFYSMHCDVIGSQILKK